MRQARRSLPHLALAGAALLLSSLAVCAGSPAVAASAKAASKWAGSYQSDPPKDGKSSASMSVSLGADGTATLSEDAGKGPATYFGHWTDSGNQITVTLDAAGGTPAIPPMTFAPSHDGLQAVTWDHAAWGKLTPPPMKRVSSADWHNKGRHGWL